MALNVEEIILECPFCKSLTIKVLHKLPSLREYKTSWGGSKPGWKKTQEEFIVQSGCSNCGKSEADVKQAFKTGTPEEKARKRKRYEEIMKLREEIRAKRR